LIRSTKKAVGKKYTTFEVQGTTYEIENWVLKHHRIQFFDLNSVHKAAIHCLAFKCNQVIEEGTESNPRYFFDTMIFFGIVSSKEYNYPQLLKLLHSDEKLDYSDKIELQSLTPTNGDVFNPDNLAQYLRSNCTRIYEDRKAKIVPLRPLYKVVAERERKERPKGTPRQAGSSPQGSSPVKRGPATPKSVNVYGLTALKEAYKDTNGVIDSPEKLGRLIMSQSDNCALYEIIARNLVCGTPLETKEKAALTNLYKSKSQEWKDWFRKKTAEFTGVVNGEEDSLGDSAATHASSSPLPSQDLDTEDDEEAVEQQPRQSTPPTPDSPSEKEKSQETSSQAQSEGGSVQQTKQAADSSQMSGGQGEQETPRVIVVSAKRKFDKILDEDSSTSERNDQQINLIQLQIALAENKIKIQRQKLMVAELNLKIAEAEAIAARNRAAAAGAAAVASNTGGTGTGSAGGYPSQE
jgi:hypothetical protein